MPTIRVVLSVVLACAVIARPGAQTDGVREALRVREAMVVLDEVTAAADQSVPRSILDKAEAIAIFPGLIKAGFVVGGCAAVNSSLRPRRAHLFRENLFQTGNGLGSLADCLLSDRFEFRAADVFHIPFALFRFGEEFRIGDHFGVTVAENCQSIGRQIGRRDKRPADQARGQQHRSEPLERVRSFMLFH